jgi:hypothetical protein
MNNDTLQEDWELAVVLGTQPKIIRIQRDAKSFELQGDHFQDVGFGHHNGFYDFLRSQVGRIIGIRYFPAAQAEVTLKAVAAGEHITRTSAEKMTALLIFWGADRHFNPEFPSDQYFGNNFIYRSNKSGALAVGFGIDILTADEKASLKQISESAG